MQKLSISFSGGRTSAYMTKMLLDNYADQYEFDVVFANTGQEHERTLEFIKNCDDEWGFNTTWIEAKVIEDAGTSFNVVTFETAARKGEPFVSVINKYGISNQAYPHCTRELKLQPMLKYYKDKGWNDHNIAIGIRADEIRRVSKHATQNRIVYPLIDLFPTDKPFILDWFKQQPFDLDMPERLGNCVWCWKKTMSKHLKLIKDNPGIYDFPRRMEQTKGLCGYNEDGTHRVFFRGNRSTDDLFEIASHDTQMDLFNEIIMEDATNECGESCEVYPMENLTK